MPVAMDFLLSKLLFFIANPAQVKLLQELVLDQGKCE